MRLDDVHRGITKHKRSKRVGRGPGSGHGKTSGRGHKGQGQLAGWSRPAIFEGGTQPLIRRIPKRGFNNPWALTVAIVNLSDLELRFETGDEVTPESLRAKNLAKKRCDVVKVLGNGNLTKRLKISAHRFSQSALEKIQKAGGEAIVLSIKPRSADDEAKDAAPSDSKKKAPKRKKDE